MPDPEPQPPRHGPRAYGGGPVPPPYRREDAVPGWERPEGGTGPRARLALVVAVGLLVLAVALAVLLAV